MVKFILLFIAVLILSAGASAIGNRNSQTANAALAHNAANAPYTNLGDSFNISSAQLSKDMNDAISSGLGTVNPRPSVQTSNGSSTTPAPIMEDNPTRYSCSNFDMGRSKLPCPVQ